MDFKGYFNPLKAEVYQNQNNWQTTQLGHQMQTHNLSVFPDQTAQFKKLSSIIKRMETKNCKQLNSTQLTQDNAPFEFDADETHMRKQ